MNKKLIKMYYESRVAFQIIGCLLKNQDIIRDKKYNLIADDFYEPFHKYIFSAIYNLYMTGIEKVTLLEVESYLNKNNPKYYQIVFEHNDGIEWMQNALEYAELTNFNYNYTRLKKMSLLRDLLSQGIDVSEILDLQEIDSTEIEKQANNFNKKTITEILKHFEKDLLLIKRKYDNYHNEEYLKAGDDSEEILDMIEKGETYGLLSFSGYKNRITYGNRRGKFHLCSGGSGVGKSRTALCEIAYCTAVELWDHDQKKFVKNPNNPNGDLSGIYVGTELDLKKEVSIILWAIISGIETSKILEKDLTKEEWDRIYYAIDVLKRSKIHLYNESNYDITYLDNLLVSHELKGENIYVLGIDYIAMTGNITMEAKSYSNGMITREDQIYLYMSTMLKERIAKKHDIYVSSSTQLNRNKSNPLAERDESMIRGSFSLCDKVDIGSLILEPTKRELEKVDNLIKTCNDKWCPLKPNQVEHIFKNRGGKFKKIRIFRNVNLGNMNSHDLFVTDWDFKLIADINQILPEYIDDDCKDNQKNEE